MLLLIAAHRRLEFECVDGHDAEEWARELGSKEGVTRKQNPGPTKTNAPQHTPRTTCTRGMEALFGTDIAYGTTTASNPASPSPPPPNSAGPGSSGGDLSAPAGLHSRVLTSRLLGSASPYQY
eukprot:590012-Rhodomonas_salina.2